MLFLGLSVYVAVIEMRYYFKSFYLELITTNPINHHLLLCRQSLPSVIVLFFSEVYRASEMSFHFYQSEPNSEPIRWFCFPSRSQQYFPRLLSHGRFYCQYRYREINQSTSAPSLSLVAINRCIMVFNKNVLNRQARSFQFDALKTLAMLKSASSCRFLMCNLLMGTMVHISGLI